MNFLPAFSRKTLGIIILLGLIAAVPITVFTAQRQQELRQRAAENPTNFKIGALNVFVGYGDNIRPDPNFPVPWEGSPNTTYIGGGDSIDAGAIRIENPSDIAVKVSSVTVTFPNHFLLVGEMPQSSLGGSFVVAAHSSVILTQTRSYDFDTSEMNISGATCGQPATADNNPPEVVITLEDGTTETLKDTAHVLDTGGRDAAGCNNANESQQWKAIGTIGGISGFLSLAPGQSQIPIGTSVTLSAQLTDSSNTLPLSNVAVDFTVFSGPNTGKTGHIITNAQGIADFSYTSTDLGTDNVKATISNASGGSFDSSTAVVNWTVQPTATPLPTATLLPTVTPIPTATPKSVLIYYTQAGGVTPLSKLTLSEGSPTALDLWIDTNTNSINGFDITSKTTGQLLFQSLTEGPEAAQFNTSIFNVLSDGSHTVRFSKVSSDTTASITGKLLIGHVLLAIPGAGSGTIEFPKTIITSPSSNAALSATPSPLTYQIAQAPTPIPSATPVPTATPIPTATPTPKPNETLLNLTLLLSGIGVDIPGSPGNKNPKHTSKKVTIQVLDNNNRLISEKTGTVIYASESGKFNGTVNFGTVLTSGDYHVKVDVPKYLRKLLPAIQNITAGTTNTISEGTLIIGDMNDDNVLNILDYNIYMSCFNQKVNTPECGSNKDKVDLNDDGQADSPFNLSDYRLLFASFATQKGD